MNQSAPSKFSVALKWGGIATAILIIFGLITYLLEVMNQTLGTVVSIVVLTVTALMAIKEYRDGNRGFVTYGAGLGLGMFTHFFTAVFSTIWMYLFLEVIAPGYRSLILVKAREQMESRGLDADQIDATFEQMPFFFSTTWFSIVNFIGVLIMALIISLIVAAILKKDDPNNGMDMLDDNYTA